MRLLTYIFAALSFAYVGVFKVLGEEQMVIPDHFYYEEGSRIKLSHGTVNYQLHQENENGPVSVCLHCFMGTISDCSSISKNLAKNGYRALRFDFYGHGLSQYKNFGYYTVDDYVDQTMEILEKLGLYNVTSISEEELNSNTFVPKLHVVGTSLGGFVAMRIAQRYSKHISKLVLDAPPGLLKKKVAPYLQYSIVNYPLQLIANIYSPVWGCYQFLDPPTENLSSPKLDFRAKHYCKQILLTSLQLFLGINLWNNLEIYHEFSKVDVPTLFFWGAEDRLCPLSSAVTVLNEYVPNSKIIVYENCKHRCSKYCKEQFVKDTIRYFNDEISQELVSVSQYYNSVSDIINYTDKRLIPSIRGTTLSSSLEPTFKTEDTCLKGSSGSQEIAIQLASSTTDEDTDAEGSKNDYDQFNNEICENGNK
ncbi:secrted alpha beta hydrolase superfamiy protein [Cryptosporidium ubiquitum]|uniref:Secrted alpha beta hydrolase superfamiy protein n=1 Tax=Cryptosporidium ubiquitum TaxID=857276 RepID=A0A1J4MBY1_9CRYT|nr:secrted alpha beta hydrolase superfamiy protein [Cryptosporidium ubiquitum]OII70987.1 secrted alpha beta hydrolase superfamiy protein [Cryptosporidium ubiquitum]